MTGSYHVHSQVRPRSEVPGGRASLGDTPSSPGTQLCKSLKTKHRPSGPHCPQPQSAGTGSGWPPATFLLCGCLGGSLPGRAVAVRGAPWDLPSCPAHPVGAPGTPPGDPHPEASGCPLGWGEPGPPWGGAAPSAPLAAPPWTKLHSPGGESTDKRDLPPPMSGFPKGRPQHMVKRLVPARGLPPSPCPQPEHKAFSLSRWKHGRRMNAKSSFNVRF